MKTDSDHPFGERLWIVILTLATALIHFSLNFIQGYFDIMFTLNGIGYLVLLAALLMNQPILVENRRWVRRGLIGFAAVSIVAWIILGDKTWWLGWLDKAVEVALIALLLRLRPWSS